MAYTKTNWVDDAPPYISAENLNKIEDSVAESAYTLGTFSPVGFSLVQSASVSSIKSILNLNNVDNTSDLDKPINAQTQIALNAKLNAAAYINRFKGKYISLAALQSAYPTASDGDYALVDAGVGSNAIQYIWDAENGWVESVDGVSISTTDQLIEGQNNRYFTNSRAIGATLNGLDFSSAVSIGNGDSIYSAFGKVQAQINIKEPTVVAGTSTQYYRGDKTWQTLDKSAVGLNNVDNTSDANKPISSATQTALNGKQTLNTALTAISGLSPVNDDILQYKAGAWANRTLTQFKADLSLAAVATSGSYNDLINKPTLGTAAAAATTDFAPATNIAKTALVAAVQTSLGLADTSTQNTLFSAKGVLISGSATASTPIATTVGTNGQVLSANSANAGGLAWITPTAAATTVSPVATVAGVVGTGTAFARNDHAHVAQTSVLTGTNGITTSASGTTIGGSQLYTIVSLGNLTAAPTAAASVDIGCVLQLVQTSASVSISLPPPTVATAGRVVVIQSKATGTASIVINNRTLRVGRSLTFIWDGAAWTCDYEANRGVLSQQYSGGVSTYATNANAWTNLLTVGSITTSGGNIQISFGCLVGSQPISGDWILGFRLDTNAPVVVSSFNLNLPTGMWLSGTYTFTNVAAGTYSIIMSGKSTGSSNGAIGGDANRPMYVQAIETYN